MVFDVRARVERKALKQGLLCCRSGVLTGKLAYSEAVSSQVSVIVWYQQKRVMWTSAHESFVLFPVGTTGTTYQHKQFPCVNMCIVPAHGGIFADIFNPSYCDYLS